MQNETHQLEQAVVLLMNFDGWELEWCGDSFLNYDAFGKTPKGIDCIIEFKFRRTYYETKILEKYKYQKLMENECLKFYYVFDSKGSYLYWLDKLELEDETNMKMKKTTDFENTNLINKQVYLLSEKQAALINKNN